jgi:S-adenosylmethionine:tRNA ribosyltransferase-isomerase
MTAMPAIRGLAEAHEPPEARGLARDEVRLLVAERAGGRLRHARFRDLPDFLEAGDLLVINTSATLPAAVPAKLPGGEPVDLHLSTPLPEAREAGAPSARGAGAPPSSLRWVVELRRDGARFRGGRAGGVLALPGGGRAELLAPYLGSERRLWVAELRLPEPLLGYLTRHGRPIRYRHVRGERSLADYQTAYAVEPGSAEMPSAGRPFTPELVTALIARGIAVAPVVLHTGVSSLELGERPYPEPFRVPPATARLATATRRAGGRVIAVGTTVVRALESAAGDDGSIEPASGWTELVVTSERGVRATDGLVTGWHDPDASHVELLEAVGSRDLIERSYAEALAAGYRRHEFGDAHLILP